MDFFALTERWDWLTDIPTSFPMDLSRKRCAFVIRVIIRRAFVLITYFLVLIKRMQQTETQKVEQHVGREKTAEGLE